MPGGPGEIVITGTADTARVEAPVTVKAYLICAFAAFGGIFFGYDTGWMSGVLGRYMRGATPVSHADVRGQE